ncbi:hypothetical protein ACIQY5_19195 [Peribacillus frigoritolerans]|uniref:hypothetical protein n=1 Tax=Peribacillus frigoritolerans TaxID=450367 RepID=UPI00380C8777
MAVATAKEKVLQFMADYESNVSKLNANVEACQNRINDINLEVKYIKDVELVPAIEKRIIEGDNTEEVRLRKKLTKLDGDLVCQTEDLIVLESLIPRYLVEAADKVAKLQALFQEEKREVESAQYGKMMKAKADYMETIQKESKALHEFNSADVKLQEVQYAAGRVNSIWTELEVKTAASPDYKDKSNGVYLQLPLDDVKKLVKGTMKETELDYLNKFK